MSKQTDRSKLGQRIELNTTRRDLLAGIGGLTGASALGLSVGTDPVRAATDEYGTRIATCEASSQVAYTQGPHAEYDTSANTTFQVFRGADADPYALKYDHDTNTFSDEVKIGTNPLPNNDKHGVPTMTVDADGILHVFYGSHGAFRGPDADEPQYARSTQPYDITNWENFDLSNLPDATYTSVCTLNNNIYGFYRGYDHERGVLIQSTDGGDTWNSYTVVDNRPGPGSDDDVYAEDVDSYNGGIYFTWVTAYGGGHGAERQMPRMAYFDPETESVSTYDGVDLGSTVNWDERHQCNVYDHREDDANQNTSERVVTARHGFNPATDEAYVTFPITREDNRSSVQDFMISIYDGISDGSGSWSTQQIADLSTEVISNYAAPRVNSDDNVECVVNADGESGGGASNSPGNSTADGVVATLEDDGSWTTRTVLEDATYKSGVVRNGTDEFIGYVGENNGSGTYNNRIWAIGTDFVGSRPAPAAPSNLSAGHPSPPPGYPYSSVNLDWEASPDSDSVHHYNIYVNGSKWTESTDTSEKVRGLSSDTSYEFYVTAVRGDGCRAVESGRSNTITEATHPGGGKAAYYSITEGSGNNLFDDSGSSRNGDIGGTSWATDTSSPGADWNNIVLTYGDGDTVVTPNNHFRGASEFTQIAWIKLDSKSGDRSISGDLGRAGGSNWSHYWWYDNGTNSLSVIVRDDTGNRYKMSDTGVSLPIGSWVMVSWTYNESGELTLYKNDSEVDSMSVKGQPLNNGTTGRDLGADSGRHPSLHGDLHSTIEWTEEKTGSFIKDYYNAKVNEDAKDETGSDNESGSNNEHGPDNEHKSGSESGPSDEFGPGDEQGPGEEHGSGEEEEEAPPFGDNFPSWESQM